MDFFTIIDLDEWMGALIVVEEAIFTEIITKFITEDLAENITELTEAFPEVMTAIITKAITNATTEGITEVFTEYIAHVASEAFLEEKIGFVGIGFVWRYILILKHAGSRTVAAIDCVVPPYNPD